MQWLLNTAKAVKLQFGMLATLWKVTAADCRCNLLLEFIFDPTSFKARYFEEMKFRHTLDEAWQGPKK
ncbi:MAG: hypothetical protein Q8R30_04855 [bacterium]|nr:hypothetical protein [bacterium]MDZ4285498.1 hypothetical protein [Candidatus Sungbacteria bacterium]